MCENYGSVECVKFYHCTIDGGWSLGYMSVRQHEENLFFLAPVFCSGRLHLQLEAAKRFICLLHYLFNTNKYIVEQRKHKYKRVTGILLIKPTRCTNFSNLFLE